MPHPSIHVQWCGWPVFWHGLSHCCLAHVSNTNILIFIYLVTLLYIVHYYPYFTLIPFMLPSKAIQYMGVFTLHTVVPGQLGALGHTQVCLLQAIPMVLVHFIIKLGSVTHWFECFTHRYLCNHVRAHGHGASMCLLLALLCFVSEWILCSTTPLTVLHYLCWTTKVEHKERTFVYMY